MYLISPLHSSFRLAKTSLIHFTYGFEEKPSVRSFHLFFATLHLHASGFFSVYCKHLDQSPFFIVFRSQKDGLYTVLSFTHHFVSK